MTKNITLRELNTFESVVTELAAAYEGMRKFYIEFFYGGEVVMKVDATLESNGELFYGWLERWDDNKVAYVENLHPCVWNKIKKVLD